MSIEINIMEIEGVGSQVLHLQTKANVTTVEGAVIQSGVYQYKVGKYGYLKLIDIPMDAFK